jgi:hypothetical protein
MLTQAPASAGAPSVVEGLTVRQLAGQHVIYSYPGAHVAEGLLDQIRRGEAAGVTRRLRAVRRRIIELRSRLVTGRLGPLAGLG